MGFLVPLLAEKQLAVEKAASTACSGERLASVCTGCGGSLVLAGMRRAFGTFGTFGAFGAFGASLRGLAARLSLSSDCRCMP
mmetsp:Transcript_117705/g.228849  ORF Transcript_117705/g.228849 Transcript_117705/m.228849 type:complete len:82 (-) Transcript_117705:663-908(-)